MAEKREKKKLGSLLLEEGRITLDQLKEGITEQKETGERLGGALVRLGFVTEEDIASAVSTQLGIPLLDLETAVVEPRAVELIPERLAEKCQPMPVCLAQGELVVAMADPLNLDAIQDLEFASDRNIEPAVATATGIGKAIRTHYHITEPMDEIVGKMSAGLVEVVPERIDVTEDIAAAAKKGASPPIIRMVNNIVHDAVKAGASDIHLEPTDREVAVRQRIDGIMRTVFNLPKWVQGAVTSRVKIIGKLDIAEKRVP